MRQMVCQWNVFMMPWSILIKANLFSLMQLRWFAICIQLPFPLQNWSKAYKKTPNFCDFKEAEKLSHSQEPAFDIGCLMKNIQGFNYVSRRNSLTASGNQMS